MSKRLTGIVALGAATLFLGAVPAHAADATAPATTAAYVEWSSVEWSTTVATPEMVLSKYVEW